MFRKPAIPEQKYRNYKKLVNDNHCEVFNTFPKNY